MPDAIAFTQDAFRLLVTPTGCEPLKAQDNKLARMLGIPVGRVQKLRRGYTRPNSDELLTIIVRLRETRETRKGILDEMERKVGIALAPDDGTDAGPLVVLAREPGNRDR